LAHLFFGDWCLDVAGRRVLRGDDVHRLTPRLVALLRVFVESGGRVVTKEELMQEVWNGRAVEEGNLNRAVSTLRGILGDSPSRADLIETIPRVGYRFVPPVQQRPIGGTGVRVAPVGREAELTTLDLLLDQAKGGRETVALVSGEAGMGKTALVTEFLSRLSEKAIPAGRAACTERLAGTSPYASILELIGNVLRDLRLQSEAGDVFPEYDAVFRGDRDDSLASVEERSRLIHALLEWLGTRHPLVLFIDDWHWADASSIDLFTWLTVQLRSRPILWILAYRHTRALLTGPSFRAARLTMKGMANDIDLRGLPPESIGAYLRFRFGLHDFPPELADALFEQTGGNPLFLTGVVDEMRRDGVTFRERPGQPWKLRYMPGRGRLPGGIETLIQKKLAQLPEVDRSLLEAACVQGMEFDVATVASHCAMDAGTALDRLIALQEQQGYVRWVGSGSQGGVESPHFLFTHSLYQNALFELIGPERRRDLSLLLASRMKKASPAEPRAPSEIAFLAREGEDYASAYRIFRDEASRAARSGAFREAIALARDALAIAPQLPGGDASKRIRLELARYHRTLRSHHDMQQAVAHCHEVLELDPECAEAQVVLASTYMLLSSYSGGPPRQLIPLAKRHAELVRTLDPNNRELHTVVGLIQLMYDWNWPAARKTLTRAIESDGEAAMPHQFFGFYWLAMGDVEAALAASLRAREKQPYSPMIHSNHAWMLYFARRFAESVEELQALVDRNPTFWRAYLNLGWSLCQLERYEHAMAALDTAVAMNDNPTIRTIQAYSYARAGRVAEAKRIRARLIEGVEYVTPYWQAWLSLGLGDVDGMFEQFERALVDREFCLIFINVDPALERVRSSPRFKRLAGAVGLPAKRRSAG